MSYTMDYWWSPNCNGGNGKQGITIHHAATTNFDMIGQTFQNTATQTSAHYGVEPGHVCQYVSEDDVAWQTGNNWGNNNTIGIETVNCSGDPDWEVSEDAIDTLVELVADIAARNGFYPLSHGENLWGHRDFYNTFCPGVLYDRLDEIAQRANAIIDGTAQPEPEPYVEPTYLKERDMQFIFQPNDHNALCYYDGQNVHYLRNPDDVVALNMCYQQCFGRDIPVFKLGGEGAPWADRLLEAVTGDERGKGCTTFGSAKWVG